MLIKPDLSIVMPCLNEELTLAICLYKANNFLEESKINGELIVVDNGSVDSSVQIAKSFGAKVIIVEQKGYGNALIAGISIAEGRYIIMGDADDSYDFSNLGSFVEKLDEGYEMVIGNRFKGGIEKGAMPFIHRYLGNPVLSFVGRLFFNQKIRDFHCGLRAFTKDAVGTLKLDAPGMEFASEMIVKASLKGLKLTEVPTKLYKDGRDRKPHLSTWRDGWRHLKFLLLLCPRWLFLFPGLVMVIFGSLFSILLSVSQLQVGDVNFGIHTLFYAAICHLLGFQFAMFYFFCKAYWNSIGIIVLKDYQKNIIKLFSIERGLISGFILVIIGLLMSFYAVSEWDRLNFGDLDPTYIFKIVIPAGFLIILGFQIIFASLFLTTIGYSNRSKSAVILSSIKYI